MNREEILSKSREENQNGDEREQQVVAKAGSLAFHLGAPFCILLAGFVNIATHREQSTMPLWALYEFMSAINCLYVGAQLKSKRHLFAGAVWGVLCIASLTIVVLDCTGVSPQ